MTSLTDAPISDPPASAALAADALPRPASELPVTVYSPESQIRQPGELIGSMFRDLGAGRYLAWRLAVRDIQAQYRQTMMGMIWAFVTPLATTLAWMFLNASGVVQVADTGIPYPAFVFIGTMLWSIFIDALTGPLNQCSQAKGMLSKLNFPKESLIIAAVYKALFNSGIKIAIILLAIASFGVMPGWQILLFPLAIASLLLAGVAVGLLLTPAGLLYGDIGRVIPLAAQFLMYLTPVVFPMPKDGWAKTVVLLNPLTPIIINARNWLTGMDAEFLGAFLATNAISLLVLLVAWVIFRAAMPILIERMNA